MNSMKRNDAIHFARYTRDNLALIERLSTSEPDVHVITQLANSLLGLVVFVWERQFVAHIKHLNLTELEAGGWPRIEMVIGNSDTLGDFVYHLRNATAHGLITFSSDSKILSDVVITIEDKKWKDSPVYWCARLNGENLRDFCFKL